MRNVFLLMASVAVLAACTPAEEASNTDEAMTEEVEASETMTADASQTAEAANPLTAEWDGPYGGVPAFDQMDLTDLRPALERGMAQSRTEIEAIASNPEPATFENTIVAMERSGDILGRVFTYFSIWSSNMSSPEFREIQREMAPVLSAFNSEITQNKELFARIQAVHDGEEFDTLSPEQQRMVQLTYNGFARNGATLEGEAAERYADIQLRLSELHTQFGNNVLNDEESYVTYISEDQLSGLPESFVTAASAAAADRGREGEYAITNTRSSMDPFLTFSDEREIREEVWRTYYNRGNNGDEFDNNEIILEILALRDERVELLGYDNYADWRLESLMSGTPENAMELMEAVWPAAIARVGEEVADMQALADELGHDITIQPWDYRYYMEKIRQDRYDLDSNEVKQYFDLDQLREAMFFVSGELFGFAFEEITDGSVPVFHEDVRVWEVTNNESGDHIGLWYLDPFARTGKRSGAWASSYRSHTTFDGEETVLSSNNSNFIAGAPGEPTLISYDDATTFFHEMGHALHALSSNVTYPSQNGGVRDYTEFQSQLLERWVLTDEVIDQFLRHAETGEPMPDDLVDRIRATSTFRQGFDTTEYLASALVDMYYHTTDPSEITDTQAFEAATLASLNMPAELPMRHRSTHFGHIFSGEGYSAVYYGYMWADVLTSDAAEAFAEAPGGFYDQELAGRMVETLFSPRNSIDPAEAYRQFRGRDATIEPLMRDRGFPVPGEDED